MEKQTESKQKSIYIDEALWARAMEKSKEPQIDRSLSQIVRRLLELWLDGEIMPYPEIYTRVENES